MKGADEQKMLAWREFYVANKSKSYLQHIEAGRVDVTSIVPGSTSTPLIFASYCNDVECAKWLLYFGADVNFQERFSGSTALHYATSDEMVYLLARAGAVVDAFDNLGRTPLSRCVALRHDANNTPSRALLECRAQLSNVSNYVIVPETVARFDRGRRKARSISFLLIGIRRRRQGTLLHLNALDIIKLIAMNVWRTRTRDEWQRN